MIFSLPACAWAKAGEPISERGLRLLHEYSETENLLVHSADHATKFSLQRSEQGDYIQTNKVFVILHGLYNSPAFTKEIHEDLLSYGQNTVSVRLAKHFENPLKKLDKVKYGEWLQQMQLIRAIALELGEKVIFFGHSTGGLLAVQSAIVDPSEVQALVLFAPALKLTAASVSRAKAGAKFGVGFFDHRGRYLSPLAALQVHALSGQVMKSLPSLSHPPAIMIIDTARDGAVDIQENMSVVEGLARRGAEAQYVRLPRSAGIGHPEIMDRKSPALPLAKDFLNKLFASENQHYSPVLIK